MINCMRELTAVVRVTQRAIKHRLINDGDDILVYSDNTNVVYDLDRKRAGWRMRPLIRTFLRFLQQKRIRLRCKHVRGEENVVADALSRLSTSGDYGLKPGVLAETETRLGATAEIDLFATARNKQTHYYCTVETADENDEYVIARDAMTISWTGRTTLIQPPIPLLAAALNKVYRQQATAIVIAPRWRGAPWMHLIRQMAVSKPIVLGSCDEVLEMGPGMRASRAALPPGDLMAVLVKGPGQQQRLPSPNE